MSANHKTSGRAEEIVPSSENSANNALHTDVIGATRREGAEDTGPDSCWTLLEYCRECESMMHNGRITAMAVIDKELVMYDRNRFQLDTALGAWKQR